MVSGAVVNALAFTGGNYLFSMFGKICEAEKERKRHDLAIEALQRAETEYQHKRRQRLDYSNQQRRSEQHSEQVFENVDKAGREYWLVTGGIRRNSYTMADRKLSAEAKLSRIYYSPNGYWRGLAATKKLATAVKISEADVRDWLKKQAIWQVYLPATRHIPRPMFDEDSPNAVHKADLLYLPHDRVSRRTYKYALTVVDVASRYQEAEPLTDKSATEVAAALGRIYKHGRLTWPRLLVA